MANSVCGNRLGVTSTQPTFSVESHPAIPGMHIAKAWTFTHNIHYKKCVIQRVEIWQYTNGDYKTAIVFSKNFQKEVKQALGTDDKTIYAEYSSHNSGLECALTQDKEKNISFIALFKKYATFTEPASKVLSDIEISLKSIVQTPSSQNSQTKISMARL